MASFSGRSIEIGIDHYDGRPSGSVKINGLDVSSMVTGVKIASIQGDVCRVTLELVGHVTTVAMPVKDSRPEGVVNISEPAWVTDLESLERDLLGIRKTR